MVRPAVHMVLHIAAPGLVARLGWPQHTARAWAVMVATMVIDLDHLLAEPMYDPGRCSLGFHPLHGWIALGCYVLLAAGRKTRVLGTGLLLHLALDGLDCLWMACE